jgi:AraC-like DNA-binding protein
MLTLESAIRLVVIGQEILLGLVFLFGSGRRSARVAGALLLFCVAGYLLRSSPELSSALAAALPLLSLASVATSYCLWLFARCIFDEPLPRRWVIALFVAIGLVCWLIFVFESRVGTSVFEAASAILRATSVVIVVNTLWLAVRGRGDDLLERRRLFRTIFVVAVAAQTLIVLSVELVLGIELPPPVLSLVNVVMIGVITMGLAVMVLRLSADFFPEPSPRAPAAENEKSKPPLPAADRVLLDKLIAAMDAGLYRRTGLTITALAAELGYPEHQLRKLINRHLGFRNFSFFLNSFRIDEATERLRDPAQARTPVLTIALDLGFASLGPFNRAFKEMTGMTPTAYREQAIPANSK